MYQRKHTLGRYARRIAPRPYRSILRGLSDNNPDDLSEVDPGIYGRQVPNNPYPPTESDLPEIVVSGTHIPWWMWGIGGALAITIFLRK